MKQNEKKESLDSNHQDKLQISLNPLLENHHKYSESQEEKKKKRKKRKKTKNLNENSQNENIYKDNTNFDDKKFFQNKSDLNIPIFL